MQKTIKCVMFPVSASNSGNFAQSQQNFAVSHNAVTQTCRSTGFGKEMNMVRPWHFPCLIVPPLREVQSDMENVNSCTQTDFCYSKVLPKKMIITPKNTGNKTSKIFT